jgi:hypothetical protein
LSLALSLPSAVSVAFGTFLKAASVGAKTVYFALPERRGQSGRLDELDERLELPGRLRGPDEVLVRRLGGCGGRDGQRRQGGGDEHEALHGTSRGLGDAGAYESPGGDG